MAVRDRVLILGGFGDLHAALSLYACLSKLQGASLADLSLLDLCASRTGLARPEEALFVVSRVGSVAV